MPNEFVGPEEQVRGLANAGLGTVCVILRNGLPDRVVTPGSRFGRGWRAPLVGAVTMVPVQTDSVPFGLEIDDVLTADGYQVGLRLNALVRINDAMGYAFLTSFVTENGRNFADALLQEVQRGLEGWVNQRISAVLHADLRRRTMNSVLTTDMPFLIGTSVLKVVSFTVDDQRWDPKAIELENTLKDSPIQLATARNEEELSSYRLTVFAPLAAQLGITAAELAFPERHRLSQQNAKELALELLKPQNRSLWQRDPALLTNLFGVAGVPLPPPQVSTRPDRTELGTSAPARAPRQLDAGTGQEELTVDKRLRRQWLQHGLEAPLGLASGRTATEATVLVVTGSGQSRPTPEVFAASFSGVDLSVVELRDGDLTDIVRQWFRRCPGTSDLDVGVEVTTDEVLLVRVNGPAAPARTAVRYLDDPQTSLVPALENLLSYAEVRIVLGSAR